MQAYAQSVNLSASDLYTPKDTPMRYLNYGTAVSEASSFPFLKNLKFEWRNEVTLVF